MFAGSCYQIAYERYVPMTTTYAHLHDQDRLVASGKSIKFDKGRSLYWGDCWVYGDSDYSREQDRWASTERTDLKTRLWFFPEKKYWIIQYKNHVENKWVTSRWHWVSDYEAESWFDRIESPGTVRLVPIMFDDRLDGEEMNNLVQSL